MGRSELLTNIWDLDLYARWLPKPPFCALLQTRGGSVVSPGPFVVTVLYRDSNFNGLLTV